MKIIAWQKIGTTNSFVVLELGFLELLELIVFFKTQI